MASGEILSGAARILLVLTLAQNTGSRRGARSSLLASDWSMVTTLSSDWLLVDTRSIREISYRVQQTIMTTAERAARLNSRREKRENCQENIGFLLDLVQVTYVCISFR